MLPDICLIPRSLAFLRGGIYIGGPKGACALNHVTASLGFSAVPKSGIQAGAGADRFHPPTLLVRC